MFSCGHRKWMRKVLVYPDSESRTHTHARIHTHTHTHTHANTHERTHMHAHTHTHTHTYAHIPLSIKLTTFVTFSRHTLFPPPPPPPGAPATSPSVVVWEASTKECKTELRGHEHIVECIAWCPTWLYSGVRGALQTFDTEYIFL